MVDIVPEITKESIINLAVNDKREDGRELDEYRDISIETDVISKAEGSARVKIGDTQVIVGIKPQIGAPFPDTPDLGVLMTNCEMLPMADPTFEPGPPSEDSIELARVVDRGIRESELVDLDKLCVEEGKHVWMLFIDLHIIDNCGNLFDACELAVMAALKSTKLPSASIADDEVVLDHENTIDLPINNEVAMCTFVKIGDKLILDPTLNEEKVASARLNVGVTKDGNIAGPRVLEHMVDTVLYIEGERYFSYRILRSVKNRFGSTNEVGMFEMKNEGMVEITNPSTVLISERSDNPAGSVIVASIEGTRPLLIELQALTTPSVFGIPKRTANGIDYNRLAVLIAVIEKRAGMALGGQDVYLNVVSGIKIAEPAVDLGVVLACVSSFKNIGISQDLVAIGEVGLTGEIRAVNMIEKRVKEAERLGFKRCIIPESNKKLLKDEYKLDIIGVKNVNEAIRYILSK